MYRDRSTFRTRAATMQLQQTGIVGKIFAVLAGTVLLVLGLMFSLVIIAVAVAIGLVIWAWVWWKTRALRRQMREQMEAQMAGRMHDPAGEESASGGRVIEGEVIRADDAQDPDRPSGPPHSH